MTNDDLFGMSQNGMAILAQDKQKLSLPTPPNFRLFRVLAMTGASTGGSAPKVEVCKTLANILSRSKTPKEFEDWCVAKKILHPMDLA